MQIINWLSNNWKTITTCISIITAIVGWVYKHRAETWNRCKITISEAIEKAELLNGANGEQKKEYAMCLVKSVVKAFKDEKISEEMEKQILLTKNVNVSRNKTETY